MRKRRMVAACASIGLLAVGWHEAPARSPLQQPADAVIWQPGRLTTGDYELTPSFSPDGRTAYYSLSLPEYGRKRFIVEAARRNGQWESTRVLPFSGLYDDVDPFVSRDGRRLFFLSKRPVEGENAKADLDIWQSEWRDGDWGAPRHLGSRVNGPSDEHYVTEADDGTLYIAAIRGDSRNRGDLYRIRKLADGYGEPENLGPTINGPDHDTTPYVAPDQSFIIFAARGRPDAAGRGMDLYISFRDGDGWTAPRNLGPTINSVADDFCPLVSPDGETLFFTSERNFSDEQRSRISSVEELRRRLGAPGNSLGDIYTVRMSVVRRLVGAPTPR